jgi:selenocysteine-specific elongation factor
VSDGSDESGGDHRGLVIGTAGHIDHGKTALIGALTGVETDRLPEEKARGITIDLGFAALELPGVGRLSVVDVPGHEGLVRTMVSGATGIDLVLLVIAADEGVMPQTREHVAICNLLGITRGVVALTKIDIADEEFIELASEEVRELLEPTGLAGAPIVPVSSHSGEGLDALRDALGAAVTEGGARTTRDGPPRLCVDRVFAMRGFGTVVTGTLVGSPLDSGDAVEVLPSGKRARVRGLQTHGSETKRARPGTRCAANLQGLEIADLRRGDVVTRPDSLRPTRTADVRLSWLDSAPASDGTTSVEFLTGTSERRAHLAPIATDEFMPGESSFARLHIDGDPVAMLPGDRFIVRGFARSEQTGSTFGGGIILDIAPPHRRRSDPELVRELDVLQRGDVTESLFERVRRSGYAGVDARELAPETGLSKQAVKEILEDLEQQERVHHCGPHVWLGAEFVERMESQLETALGAFHAAEPMRPGMPRAALRGQLPSNVRREASELVLTRLEQAGRIVSEEDLVRSADHRPRLDAEAQSAVTKIIAEAKEAELEPPGPREWAERLGVSLERYRDLVAYLEREGELIRAPGDLWFAKEAVEALCERVTRYLEEKGELDTQAYKTLIGTSRRTAMPLMELLDELHITRRSGEVRVLRGRG